MHEAYSAGKCYLMINTSVSSVRCKGIILGNIAYTLSHRKRDEKTDSTLMSVYEI